MRPHSLPSKTNDDDHPQSAAAVIAGAVEGTATVSTESPSRMMTRTMSKMVPIDMNSSSYGACVTAGGCQRTKGAYHNSCVHEGLRLRTSFHQFLHGEA